MNVDFLSVLERKMEANLIDCESDQAESFVLAVVWL